VRRVIARHEAGGALPERAARGHNYDAVAELVAERVKKTSGRISAKRFFAGEAHPDLTAALDAARRVQAIIAERQRQADRDADLSSDDLMRRREVEALREAEARRSAVRQEPLPSRRSDREAWQADYEMEAGG
jgi:hypothetical protein